MNNIGQKMLYKPLAISQKCKLGVKLHCVGYLFWGLSVIKLIIPKKCLIIIKTTPTACQKMFFNSNLSLSKLQFNKF